MSCPHPSPPPDPITPEVRAAIDRRAHALSLRQFDRLRDDITEAVREHAENFPEDRDLVRMAETIDTLASDLVVVHPADLWRLTAQLGMLCRIRDEALEAVHALETATGSKWYTRAPSA